MAINVIKFDLEIKKKKKWIFVSNKAPVRELFDESFVTDSSFGGDFSEQLALEWENIEYKEIRILNSPKNLLGFTTAGNLKVFLFEKNTTAVRSKYSMSVEVIAFGDSAVERILNRASLQVRRITSIKRLKCKHIDGTKIFIYPVNSTSGDIYSYELKVRADLKSPFTAGNTEKVKWGIVILIIFAAISLFFISSNATLDQTTQTRSLFPTVCLSIFCSGIVFLILDLSVHYIVPLISGPMDKKVEIKDLSSVVETREVFTDQSVPELKVPE